MNFCKLVNLVFNENASLAVAPSNPGPVAQPTATPPQPSTTTQEPDNEESLATNVKEFCIQHKNEIKDAYTKAFSHLGANVFPDSEFDTIVYVVNKNSVRSTKDPKQVPNFVYAFPIIDLASMVKQVYIENKDVKQAQAKAMDVLKAFVTKLTTSKLTYPLDYKATDPWANSVKEAWLKQAGQLDLGKLKLDAYFQAGIENCIDGLLTQKAAGIFTRLKKEDFEPSAKKLPGYVRDVLLNTEKYTSGLSAFPEKKMSAIFGESTPKQIIAIAVAAKELFDQQFDEKITKNEEKLKNKNILTDDAQKKNLYNLFLTNKVDWKMYLNESFDFVYSNLISLLKEDSTSLGFQAGSSKYKIDFNTQKQLLVATNQETTKTYYFNKAKIETMVQKYPESQKQIQSFADKQNKTTASSRPKYENWKDATFDWLESASGPNSTEEKIVQQMIQKEVTLQNIEQSKKARQSSNYKEQNPSSTDIILPQTFLEGTYTIGDIKKYSEENEKAKVLYDRLQALADFVRSAADPAKALSALAGLGKALSFGAPEQGGKR